MKHLTHVLLALALAASSSSLAVGCKGSSATTTPAAGDNITVPLAPRKVGVRWIKSDDMTTDLSIATPQGSVPVGGKRHHRTQSEILGVGADGIVNKLAVEYLERVEVDVGPVAPPQQPSPLAGKAYVVWLADGALQATKADGSAVSAEELTELADDQDELGKPPVMEQILASRTWKVGETYAFTSAELDRLIAAKGGKGPRPATTTLTLDRVVGGDLEFTMAMRMESTKEPTMTIDFAGAVTIDRVTGRPRRIAIAGPVTGSAAGMPISGTMSGVITYEFTGP